jgi:hypothetical protein
MKDLLELNLIEEIGMPVKYAYKMRTLVLFLKPVDFVSTMKLHLAFEKCVFQYNHYVIDIECPTATVHENFKKRFNTTTKMATLDNVSQIIILVTVIIILLIIEFFRI